MSDTYPNLNSSPLSQREEWVSRYRGSLPTSPDTSPSTNSSQSNIVSRRAASSDTSSTSALVQRTRNSLTKTVPNFKSRDNNLDALTNKAENAVTSHSKKIGFSIQALKVRGSPFAKGNRKVSNKNTRDKPGSDGDFKNCCVAGEEYRESPLITSMGKEETLVGRSEAMYPLVKSPLNPFTLPSIGYGNSYENVGVVRKDSMISSLLGKMSHINLRKASATTSTLGGNDDDAALDDDEDSSDSLDIWEALRIGRPVSFTGGSLVELDAAASALQDSDETMDIYDALKIGRPRSIIPPELQGIDDTNSVSEASSELQPADTQTQDIATINTVRERGKNSSHSSLESRVHPANIQAQEIATKTTVIESENNSPPSSLGSRTSFEKHSDDSSSTISANSTPIKSQRRSQERMIQEAELRNERDHAFELQWNEAISSIVDCFKFDDVRDWKIPTLIIKSGKRSKQTEDIRDSVKSFLQMSRAPEIPTTTSKHLTNNARPLSHDSGSHSQRSSSSWADTYSSSIVDRYNAMSPTPAAHKRSPPLASVEYMLEKNRDFQEGRCSRRRGAT